MDPHRGRSLLSYDPDSKGSRKIPPPTVGLALRRESAHVHAHADVREHEIPADQGWRHVADPPTVRGTTLGDAARPILSGVDEAPGNSAGHRDGY